MPKKEEQENAEKSSKIKGFQNCYKGVNKLLTFVEGFVIMLLANLSYQQLKILNSAQNVNISPELFNNLPIYFRIQFKNTLNPKQRNLFDKLRLLSLIRCKVLANPNKKLQIQSLINAI